MQLKKKWTLGQQLWMLTGMFLLFFGFLGGFSVFEIGSLSDDLFRAAEVHVPAVRHMTLVDMMHDGLRANVLDALRVAGDGDAAERRSVQEEYEEFSKEMNANIAALQKLPLGVELTADLRAVEPEIKNYVSSAGAVVQQVTKGKTQGLETAYGDFEKQFKVLEGSLGKLGDKIRDVAQSEGAESVSGAVFVKKLSVALVPLSLLLGFAFGALIIRNLKTAIGSAVQELTRQSSAVASTSSEMQGASIQLTESATEQASALQQTASSLEEITSMVKKTSENAKALETSANASNQTATQGGAVTGEMLRSIEVIEASNQRIMGQIEDSNQKIASIVKVIGEIGSKTKVINDIVFQTKLLSFNASVEAARAGEHGKGFAVVAEEVGNLAQMSGNASKEISALLDSSTKTVSAIIQDNRTRIEGLLAEGRSTLETGKAVSARLRNSLSEIVAQSGDVSRLVSEITVAIQEQNQGIEEISKALNLLDQGAQRSSATANQSSSIAAQLLERSGNLESVVIALSALSGVSAGGKEGFQGAAENVVAIKQTTSESRSIHKKVG